MEPSGRNPEIVFGKTLLHLLEITVTGEHMSRMLVPPSHRSASRILSSS